MSGVGSWESGIGSRAEPILPMADACTATGRNNNRRELRGGGGGGVPYVGDNRSIAGAGSVGRSFWNAVGGDGTVRGVGIGRSRSVSATVFLTRGIFGTGAVALEGSGGRCRWKRKGTLAVCAEVAC